MAPDARFDVGLYSLPEAARLARVPVQTLRNWARGYRYPAGGRLVHAKPVVKPLKNDELALSFANLAEIVALAGFRQAGVSMQRVRRGLEYARRAMKIDHPFASQRILTDGIDLFWEYQERARSDAHLVNISRQGQKAFPDIVMRYLREMEWGADSFVKRWWPGGDGSRKGLVVVDPRRAFGAPVLTGTGIRTEDVFDRFQAGESMEDLADDYGLTLAQIQAAIRLETRLLEPQAA